MAENETEDILLEDEDAPKRSGLIPVVAILLVTLGGGGFVGAKTLGPKLGPTLAARAEAAPKKSGGGHGGEGEASTIHLVDNLVVNPASSSGSRFLLTSVALETGSPDDVATLKERDLEIRDAFNRVLGGKSVDELSDISRRAQLVVELTRAVSGIVGPGIVHRILIPQFVIQ